jgi:hypothetical protein
MTHKSVLFTNPATPDIRTTGLVLPGPSGPVIAGASGAYNAPLLSDCSHVEDFTSFVDALPGDHDVHAAWVALRPDEIAHASQRDLTYAVEQSRKAALMSHARIPNLRAPLQMLRLAAAHKSATGYGASDWLMAFPTTLGAFPNFCWMGAARRRLGLPLAHAAQLPPRCTACKQPLAADGGFHLYNCRAHSKARYVVHDLIKNHLHACLNSIGSPNFVEPSGAFASSGTMKRPDIAAIDLDGRAVMIDVAVIDHTATSYCQAAARTPGGAILGKELAKTRIYNDLCRAEGAEFSPFVLDQGGAWGPAARALFDRIVHAGAVTNRLGGMPPKLFAFLWRRKISISLMRESARAVYHTIRGLSHKQRRTIRSPHDPVTSLHDVVGFGSPI